MSTVRDLAAQIFETIQGQTGNAIDPRAGPFLTCAIAASIAAMPAFTAALMQCLAGGVKPPPTGYDPGDRQRCP